ncbi:flavin reductase (DIM6/NTAB) family NADH-FMN oxidoreductase RutF [Luteibacter rhizovicinus]|uniref:Flavin reductase (DIM6/NTAB) family NADH-FMN oxidoreductase RutF n=1 Tax=Luteibacter rhizovicinus TaxID=242606 RepID=A0A4R3YJ96_9GAMM|nr:flavin reductase family protein [Luteibacter rhizovicinus]TCV92765.1 flavin reductase (DIM6/NTAB) family NADH-FMN oxidoreductase RutF [Luteibacter rhizovicinus]
MSDTYFYETARGHGLPHDPFKAIVAPRPIGWISTCDGQGRGNLAPYSFFNAFSDAPPIVAFASSGYKDSIRNIEATGEFVANLAVRALAEKMSRSSASFPHGEDEMVAVGLTPAPCRLVRPARVSESPAALECRLLKILRLDDLAGTPTDTYVAFGQVVAVHIDPAFLRDGLFDTGSARPVLRAGYLADYVGVEPDTIFRMRRPRNVDEALAGDKTKT